MYVKELPPCSSEHLGSSLLVEPPTVKAAVATGMIE